MYQKYLKLANISRFELYMYIIIYYKDHYFNIIIAILSHYLSTKYDCSASLKRNYKLFKERPASILFNSE